MTHSILKRPQAERDIEECFVFIAEDNVDIATQFLVAVEESLKRLSQFPNIGTARNYQNKLFQNIRMWQVKGYSKYFIFYEVFEDRIEVVRVLHSSRDLEDVFS